MIITKRTVIRPIKLTDEPDLFEIYSKPEVFEHFGSGVYSRERHITSIKKAVANWSGRGQGDLVAEYSGKAIARLILFPIEAEEFEIGYVLHPQYWGKGFATEIASALLEHVFSLGADEVKACARESNTISLKIILGLGFRESHRELGNDGINRIYYVAKR